jgi:hypothetical protein
MGRESRCLGTDDGGDTRNQFVVGCIPFPDHVNEEPFATGNANSLRRVSLNTFENLMRLESSFVALQSPSQLHRKF